MRILLKKEDYFRMLVVSNKINRKQLSEEGLEKLKVEFYQLMILYYLYEKKFIDVSKSYKTLYDYYNEIELKLKATNVKEIKSNILERYKEILQSLNKKILLVNYIMYLTICPPELETKNMLNELSINYRKDIEENEEMNSIVTKHLSDEIVQIKPEIFNTYKNYPIFNSNEMNVKPEEHLKLFRKYLIQHNLSVFGKFFSQIQLRRVSDMICVDTQELENEICDMVINKFLYAKINRINSTVNFRKKQDYSDKLNDLNYDLGKMLEKMETTCHLIHKENLKYDIK
jgi:26S proteasome regulatory subunit N5